MADINVSELADAAGLRTYDTALPLDWYEDVHSKTGLWPQQLGFVYCYDGSTFGFPVPLTSEAVDCLYAYHKAQLEDNGRLSSEYRTLIGHPEQIGLLDGSPYACKTCNVIYMGNARYPSQA